MTSATMNNGRLPRKSLNDQIEKLDGILDMMAEAIPQVIADSVRQAVAEAVRQGVEALVREVLSNPTLFQATLTRHAPTATLAQPTATQPIEAPRRTLKDLLRNARGWTGATMMKTTAKATAVLANVWSRSLHTLRDGYTRLREVGKRAVNLCVALPGTMVVIFGGVCRSPRSAVVAMSVGVICAIAVYHAGPTIASVVSGVTSATLTAMGMVLLPLWRLLTGNEDRNV